MKDQIQRIRDQAKLQITDCRDVDAIEKLRVQLLGRKGSVTNLLHKLGELEGDERKELGQLLNHFKTELENQLEGQKFSIQRKDLEKELAQTEPLDVTLPGQFSITAGSIHPISCIMEEMYDILKRIGFSVVSGPEIELEYYNFEALNTPDDHPARNEQDTFYLKSPVLLRSHTSPVQIRTMKRYKPPIQIIAPGRVYRADYDNTHTPMFHQMEGLMVDKNISFSDLKGVIHYFVEKLFGKRKLRFRPSFFPFTEPSAEVDMQSLDPKSSADEWLEIGGCGMVHPHVFKSVGYDPEVYSGFAFGFGLERIAMLKYGIHDIRTFYENDMRMLEQF